ncbi:MAG: helix-turn-helix domain-containing protein [Pseudomonadota bacterium]
MSTDSQNTDLQGAIATLRASGVIPQVASVLQAEGPGFSAGLLDQVMEEVPAYSSSSNPDIRPELAAHLAEHVDEVCGLLAGDSASGFGFIRTHAQRRAQQKFPLDAILQAYGTLHKALSHWVRDAALKTANTSAHVRRVVAAVTDFTIAYSGAIVTLITSEYVAHTRLLAEAESDQRSTLLNLLLSGYDEADRQAATVLRRAGYLEQRQSYCVAVARSVNPQEMENAARAQRMADALSVSLRELPVRVLMGVRDNLVVVVLSGRRRVSGYTAPQQLLADRVYPALRTVGPAALIGLSGDVPATAHIPQALEQARLALDVASVGERVVPYASIPLQQMFVQVARENLPASKPGWLEAFLAANEKSRGALGQTLRAYADADMNALKAAKQLGVHANTVYSRFLKIQDVCQRNPLEFAALSELLLAIDCYPVSQQ